MTVRARQLPVLVLALTAVAALALSMTAAPPAGAIVSSTPDWGSSSQCQANGRVNVVVYLGGTLYLGGRFTSVNGQTRNRLAACDAATGNLLGWNPNANGVVRALAASPAGTRVYVGGDFTRVAGASQARVAALNPTSGAAFAWSPYVNDSVKAITTSNSGNTVYVGGDFNSAEAAGRSRLAAFNATSGKISTTFKPNVSNGTGNFATVLAMDVSPDGETLYFSGDFALVNGRSRRNAAAASSRVAVGGEFTTVAGENHSGVVQFSGTPCAGPENSRQQRTSFAR